MQEVRPAPYSYEQVDTSLERVCAFSENGLTQQDMNDIIETLKDAGFLNKEGKKFYSRHREKHRKDKGLTKCDSCGEYSDMVARKVGPTICELCRD